MENLVRIKEVENRFNYCFKNKDLITQAFTRSSFSKFINNEFLETIGDSVIAFNFLKIYVDKYGYISDRKIENFENSFLLKKNKKEEDFTKVKSLIVSNENLAKIIDSLGLIDMLQIGQSDKDNNVLKVDKVKADLLESIIGAIAIDCNWDEKTLRDIISKTMKISEILEQIDNEVKSIPTFDKETADDLLQKLVDNGYFSKSIINEQKVMDQNILNWECTITVENVGISKLATSTSKSKAKKHAAYLVLCEHYKIKIEE